MSEEDLRVTCERLERSCEAQAHDFCRPPREDMTSLLNEFVQEQETCCWGPEALVRIRPCCGESKIGYISFSPVALKDLAVPEAGGKGPEKGWPPGIRDVFFRGTLRLKENFIDNLISDMEQLEAPWRQACEACLKGDLALLIRGSSFFSFNCILVLKSIDLMLMRSPTCFPASSEQRRKGRRPG